MLKVVLASLIILVLLFGWIAVQHIARVFAARHPEFGPAREDGGCGGESDECHACHMIKPDCSHLKSHDGP